MADLARHSATSSGSENIGDVLASIRRLIAQDEANGLSETTARRLGTLSPRGEKPAAPQQPETAALAQDAAPLDDSPLVLGSDEIIGPFQPVALGLGADLSAAGVAPVTPTALSEPEMEPLFSTPSFPRAEAKEQEDTANSDIISNTTTQTQVDFMIQHAQVSAPTQLHASPLSGEPSTEPRNLFLMEEEEFVMPGTPLRGMIRETLVQELQGEFGDQFSRKLRNLVRAEIALALNDAIKG